MLSQGFVVWSVATYRGCIDLAESLRRWLHTALKVGRMIEMCNVYFISVLNGVSGWEKALLTLLC